MAAQERTPGPSPEEDLVRRAMSGCRTDQQELWTAHKRWVAAIVLAHRPRTIEVDDLMQEVAVKFVSRLDTLRDPGAFRPWLRQIVINVCRGAARGRKSPLQLVDTDSRGDEMPGGPMVPAASTPTADEAASVSDAASQLLRHALTLPPEYREPLLLRCVRSMSYQQISETLDLPVTTIETRLARARRMLREEVGSHVQ